MLKKIFIFLFNIWKTTNLLWDKVSVEQAYFWVWLIIVGTLFLYILGLYIENEYLVSRISKPNLLYQHIINKFTNPSYFLKTQLHFAYSYLKFFIVLKKYILGSIILTSFSFLMYKLVAHQIEISLFYRIANYRRLCIQRWMLTGIIERSVLVPDCVFATLDGASVRQLQESYLALRREEIPVYTINTTNYERVVRHLDNNPIETPKFSNGLIYATMFLLWICSEILYACENAVQIPIQATA